jgi:hypothetical protein
MFRFVVTVGSGAVLVLVGLLMEQAAEKSAFKNVKQFRRCKSVKLFGELFVIFGVLLEVIVAGFSAKDEWLANPLNQPISDISARVMIEVEGTNFDEIDPKRHFRPNVEWVSMMGLVYSGEQPTNGTALGSALLVSSSYIPMLSGAPTPSHRAYALRFEALFEPGNKERAGKAGDINRIEFLRIAALFLPTNSEILGGNVTLVINADVKREYKIPPQKKFNPKLNPFDNLGQGVVLIATNTSPAQVFKK